MVNIYTTFGQKHNHFRNGIILDKDCVGIIKAENESKARELASAWFGDKFMTTYTQEYLDKNPNFIDWFPRGFITLN